MMTPKKQPLKWLPLLPEASVSDIQTSDDVEKPIEIVVEIKQPSRGSKFPCSAFDVHGQPSLVKCNRCGNDIPILFASSEKNDLFTECQDCKVKYEKFRTSQLEERTTVCPIFAKADTIAKATHDNPPASNSQGTGKSSRPSEPSYSNKRIPSRGEAELKGQRKIPRRWRKTDQW